VPPAGEDFTTIGPEVCLWIMENLCHGPGDLLGEPVELTPEELRFICRAYEVFPKGHEQAGRRRFKRAVLSRRKGVGKTEIAAWLAIAELDPECPVRFDGWRGNEPVGRPVRDPYIPMVAVTEEQTEDLAYAAAREILSRSKVVDRYDIGIERITPANAPGKIVALASAPSARDGARTTFQHFDETHLFETDKLLKAHATMQRNIPKRKAADAWSLETTTMYAPGMGSVAESAHVYAQAVARGAVDDPRLLFDHRQADEAFDITDPDQLEQAIVQASGDAIEWADVPGITAMFLDPTSDENALRRYWLNQPRRSSEHWPPAAVWPERAATRSVEPGARVVLAFDGSYSRDSTALIGCTVEQIPHVFVVNVWERTDRPGWRVPRSDVEEAIRNAMELYEVAELAADPPGWHRELEDWETEYGEVVVRFETKQPARMGPACDSFEQAVKDGEVTHDGAEVIARHLSNAVPVERRGYTVITKDGADSPHKIDAAVAAIVAHARATWHFNEGELEPLIAWA
jgi:phage terminase large subunit-like protein